MKNPFKRPLFTALFITSFVIIGLSGFFIAHLVINNSSDSSLEIFSVEEEITKGDPVKIVAEVYIDKRGDVLIKGIFFGLFSVEYDFNITAYQEINEIRSGKTAYNITILLDPLLNSTDGFYALNVGDYNLYSANITFGHELPSIYKKVNFDFTIINPEKREQIINGNFSSESAEWDINKADDVLITDIASSSPLSGSAFHIVNIDNITITNSTWVSISQNLNLTQTHFVSFDILLDKPGTIGVNLTVDSIPQSMNLTLTELSDMEQIIYFEHTEGIANVTILISFIETSEHSNVYVDNISIISYVHRVFVVALNDNWEIMEDEIARENPLGGIINASYYFEKDLGIKLIPLLELTWMPPTTESPEVINYALQITGELLNLDDIWDWTDGRSTNNNGFDFLSCFSNQTSDHYGFAFLESNIAFHFARSRELENYLGFDFSIPEEWVENIIQHEISHDFGAEDRDRARYDPSIMSKPYTVDQALADLAISKLWSQVNNWLIEDILLMLENRAMFD